MGRFAQERSIYGALRQEWSDKSLIEGGMGIRVACAADAHSSFNE